MPPPPPKSTVCLIYRIATMSNSDLPALPIGDRWAARGGWIDQPPEVTGGRVLDQDG